MLNIKNLLQNLQYNSKDPLLFNSAFFLIFMLLFFIVYQFVYKRTMLRIIVVTTFSLFFFYKACGWYVLCIIVAAIVDFNISNAIYNATEKKKRKLLLIVSIFLNLGLLFFFKYTNFFIETINDLKLGVVEPLHLLLPIGISFYTFENLSYTIDVYRKEFKPVQSFWDYLFFLSFFPKLMMGPIVRAADFVPQIRKKINISNEQVNEGLYLIGSGIFKKMIISDYLYSNYVERVFDNPSLYTGVECITGVYGYAMVIYCDFSGYSSMALGMGKWMGFEINPNFASPYQSKSITEFWRRWHISLSTWLKDYLYIPLGGNRCSKPRQNVNLFATMLLGGLWHGASWNYVFWGGLHGTALGIDKVKNNLIERNSFVKNTFDKNKKLFSIIGVIITFHFVCLCWIFFKANTFADSSAMLHQITSNLSLSLLPQLIMAYTGVFLILLLALVLHFIPLKTENKAVAWLGTKNIFVKIGLFFILIFIAIQMKQAEAILPVYLQF
jgi:alginate O-acetyltransferase complex protein AlgI